MLIPPVQAPVPKLGPQAIGPDFSGLFGNFPPDLYPPGTLVILPTLPPQFLPFALGPAAVPTFFAQIPFKVIQVGPNPPSNNPGLPLVIVWPSTLLTLGPAADPLFFTQIPIKPVRVQPNPPLVKAPLPILSTVLDILGPAAGDLFFAHQPWKPIMVQKNPLSTSSLPLPLPQFLPFRVGPAANPLFMAQIPSSNSIINQPLSPPVPPPPVIAPTIVSPQMMGKLGPAANPLFFALNPQGKKISPTVVTSPPFTWRMALPAQFLPYTLGPAAGRTFFASLPNPRVNPDVSNYVTTAVATANANNAVPEIDITGVSATATANGNPPTFELDVSISAVPAVISANVPNPVPSYRRICNCNGQWQCTYTSCCRSCSHRPR